MEKSARHDAPDSEFVWVLDPIDGTLPFLAGIPVFGTLLALLHNGAPVLGIIDMPMTGERWIGADGLQTTRNGKPVHSRPCADLSMALISTSNPDYYDHTNAPALERLKKATQCSAQPLAASVQSNRKRNFEKANIEYRTRNNEYRSKVFYRELKIVSNIIIIFEKD